MTSRPKLYFHEYKKDRPEDLPVNLEEKKQVYLETDPVVVYRMTTLPTQRARPIRKKLGLTLSKFRKEAIPFHVRDIWRFAEVQCWLTEAEAIRLC
jgi:hypothetical protein